MMITRVTVNDEGDQRRRGLLLSLEVSHQQEINALLVSFSSHVLDEGTKVAQICAVVLSHDTELECQRHARDHTLKARGSHRFWPCCLCNGISDGIDSERRRITYVLMPHEPAYIEPQFQ